MKSLWKTNLTLLSLIAVTARPIAAADPVVTAIGTYITNITPSHSSGFPSMNAAQFADSSSKWIGKFDLKTHQYSDLAGAYVMPYTGSKFGDPIPTTIPEISEIRTSDAHLMRMRYIATALNKGLWKDLDIAKARDVLVNGMDYWASINPYSYYDAKGQCRFTKHKYSGTEYNFNPSNYRVLASTGKRGQNDLVSKVILASQSLLKSNLVTADNLKLWAVAVDDTSENIVRAGMFHGGTWNQGVNWWTDVYMPRVVRNWALERYARADQLLYDARDSVKISFVEGKIPSTGDNYQGSGFRPDGSYNMHGIPLNGQYGQMMVREAFTFGTVYVKGTNRYELPTKAWEMLVNYCLDGSMRLSYRGQFTPDVMGRYFTQRYYGAPYVERLAGHTENLFLNVNASNPPILPSYRTAERNAAFTGWTGKKDQLASFPWPDKPSKVFPFADAASWLRTDAGVFWKGTSNRLARAESYAKNEDADNRLVLEMGMGTQWILAHDGKQYSDSFMVVLDPSLLPGVTSDSFYVPVWPATTNLIPGVTSFVGGASDGKYMALALDYDLGSPLPGAPGQVVGKKAVFFLDSAVVSLAAGMKWEKPTNVRTSLNQLNRRLDFLVATGDSKATTTTYMKLGNDRVSGNNLRWAWHDSVGYVFPPNVSATVDNSVRNEPSSRADLGLVTKNVPVTENGTVASLWLSHGKKNANLKDGDAFWYAYYPGISRTTFQKEATKALNGDVWKIDTNTAAIQAVSVDTKSWHGAVFHSAGQVTTKTKTPFVYSASRPCALLLRTTSDKLFLSLSDPAQGTDPVTVTLGVELEGVTYDKKTKLTTVVIQPSTKPDSAGMTVQYSWKLKNGTVGVERSNTPNIFAQARLLPGAGIVVAGAAGTYQVDAHDMSGRTVGAWSVVVPLSGHAMVPLQGSFAKWVVNIRQ